MKWIVGTAVCLVMLAISPTAYSCSCDDLTPRDAFERSRVVFIGEFISYVRSNHRGKRQPDKIKLKVEKSWKSEVASEITLPYWDIPGMCGDWRFVKGGRYLIYATEYKGELLVAIDCGRNRAIKYAAEDLKYLATR